MKFSDKIFNKTILISSEELDREVDDCISEMEEDSFKMEKRIRRQKYNLMADIKDSSIIIGGITILFIIACAIGILYHYDLKFKNKENDNVTIFIKQ